MEEGRATAGGGKAEGPGRSDRDAAARKGSFARQRRRSVAIAIASIAVLAASFVVCLGIGRSGLPPDQVVGSLLQRFFGVQGGLSDADVTIVCDVRLPVVCAAALVGAALSASGAAYQGLFRNPLVSPDILGASAGAAFGAALALLWNLPNGLVQGFAFAGGFIAVLITYFSAKYLSSGANQILLLVLAGMIVQTLFRAFVEAVKYIADPFSTLPTITYWLMGSLSKVTWDSIAVFLVPFFVGAVPILFLRWRLNTLSLGDDEARSLGLNVGALRAVFIFCATLLTSAVVAIAGIIGWVGLIIPHLVRFMLGPDNRMVIPMSLVVGGTFMIVVDTACRSLMASEIPLGILTAIIGAPFFFIILLRQKKGGRA